LDERKNIKQIAHEKPGLRAFSMNGV